MVEVADVIVSAVPAAMTEAALPKSGRRATYASAAEEGKLVRRDEWSSIGFQVPSATVQTLE